MSTEPPDHQSGAPDGPLPEPNADSDSRASQPPPPLAPPSPESTVFRPEPGGQAADTPVAPVTSSESSGAGGSRRRIIGGVVVVLALVAAVGFAATRIAGGDDETAGASSPEELGEQALQVFDDADVLGAVNLLLPGERQTLGEPMIELVHELERLDILSDVDLSGVQGVDVTVEEPKVEVTETEADDIVYVDITADATSDVNTDELPTGSLIDELTSGDESADETTADTVAAGGDDEVDDAVDADETSDDETEAEPVGLRLVGVEEDGQWYLSIWYWLAESMRSTTFDPETGEPLPIPEKGITPHGGETPEDAIKVVTDALGERDLEGIIAAINPNEAQALQRYAPLFIEDGQQVLEDSGFEIDFTDVDVRAEGEGDQRQIYFEKVAADISFDLEASDLPVEVEGDMAETFDEAHVVWEDGCLTVEGAVESFDTCELEAEGASREDFRELLDEELGDSDELVDFFDAAVAAFDDFEAPGITVSQVDGQWYISPMSTGWTWMLAVTGALDATELDELVDLGKDAAHNVEDQFIDIED